MLSTHPAGTLGHFRHIADTAKLMPACSMLAMIDPEEFMVGNAKRGASDTDDDQLQERRETKRSRTDSQQGEPVTTEELPPPSRLLEVEEAIRASIFSQLLDPDDMTGTLQNITSWAPSHSQMNATQKFVIDSKELEKIREIASLSTGLLGGKKYGARSFLGGTPFDRSSSAERMMTLMTPHDSEIDSLPIRNAGQRDFIVSSALQFKPPAGAAAQQLFEGMVSNLDYVPRKHLPETVKQICEHPVADWNHDLFVRLIDKAELLDEPEVRRLFGATIESNLINTSHRRALVEAWVPKMAPLPKQLQVDLAVWTKKEGVLAVFIKHLNKMKPELAAQVESHILSLPPEYPSRSECLFHLTNHLGRCATASSALADQVIGLPDSKHKSAALRNLTKHLEKFDKETQNTIVYNKLLLSSRHLNSIVVEGSLLHTRCTVESLHHLSRQKHLLLKQDRETVDKQIQHYAEKGPAWVKCLLISHVRNREAFLNSVLLSESRLSTAALSMAARADELTKSEKSRFVQALSQMAGNEEYAYNLKTFFRPAAQHAIDKNIDHFSAYETYLLRKVSSIPALDPDDKNYFSDAAKHARYMDYNDIKQVLEVVQKMIESTRLIGFNEGSNYQQIRHYYRDGVRASAAWYANAIVEARTAQVSMLECGKLEHQERLAKAVLIQPSPPLRERGQHETVR